RWAHALLPNQTRPVSSSQSVVGGWHSLDRLVSHSLNCPLSPVYCQLPTAYSLAKIAALINSPPPEQRPTNYEWHPARGRLCTLPTPRQWQTAPSPTRLRCTRR